MLGPVTESLAIVSVALTNPAAEGANRARNTPVAPGATCSGVGVSAANTALLDETELTVNALAPSLWIATTRSGTLRQGRCRIPATAVESQDTPRAAGPNNGRLSRRVGDVKPPGIVDDKAADRRELRRGPDTLGAPVVADSTWTHWLPLSATNSSPPAPSARPRGSLNRPARSRIRRSPAAPQLGVAEDAVVLGVGDEDGPGGVDGRPAGAFQLRSVTATVAVPVASSIRSTRPLPPSRTQSVAPLRATSVAAWRPRRRTCCGCRRGSRRRRRSSRRRRELVVVELAVAGVKHHQAARRLHGDGERR